jgi:hypothetical protein
MNLARLSANDNDLVRTCGRSGAAHPGDGAVQEDVVAAGESPMKAGADFEKGADRPSNLNPTFGLLGNPTES